MDHMSNTIFPKGNKVDNAYFQGDVWVEQLVMDDSVYNCPIYNVSFAAGGKNNWHSHPGGQILLITGGAGYYQEEGQEAQLIRQGDVVKIPPNVKHWHGASPNSWMTHLAIGPNSELGGAEWFEPVPEDVYQSLK